MASLPLSFVADLSSYLGGGNVVALDVGPDGHAYVAIAQKPLDYRTTHPSGASSGKTVPAQPQQYRVLAFAKREDSHPDDALVLDVTITECAFNAHHVQPLNDGLLLTCVRSFYRGPDDFERNGHLFSREGYARGSVLLGDGISDVQVTPSGVIWTGFFDEGVFGNYGWNVPVGASGLVAFDRAGKPLYTFTPPPGLDAICDCYALNVAPDDTVWCYYYTGFPLVCLRNFQVVKYWNIPLAGSHAFAVGDGYALFHGGYYEKNRCALFALPYHADPKLVGSFEVNASEAENQGQNTRAQDRVKGRGAALWLLRDGRHLYTVSVYDALSAVG